MTTYGHLFSIYKPFSIVYFFSPLTFTFHHHTRHNAKEIYLGYCFCLTTVSEGGYNHLTGTYYAL